MILIVKVEKGQSRNVYIWAPDLTERMHNGQSKQVKGPVYLSGLHSSGKTIAVLDEKNHYLDFGIPGEEVAFVSLRKRHGFRHGEVSDVVFPSPSRINPKCIHHRHCNSCSWQHIEYSQQLRMKHQILQQALVKYGIDAPPVPDVKPSAETWNYRHRVEYTFSSHAIADTSSTYGLGFHRSGEPGEVVDIKECFLQKEPSRQICDFIRHFAEGAHLSFYNHTLKTGLLRSVSIRINSTGEVMVLLGFNEDIAEKRDDLMDALLKEFPDIVSLNRTIHPSPSASQLQGIIHPYGHTLPYFYERSGNYRFRLHPVSFYQPNPRQADRIFQTIPQWANLSGSEKIVDLYTGVGTIALYLAPHAKHVLGIEGSAQAIEDARENARINNISNASFITGDILTTFTMDFLHQHGTPDVIVLDPPRSGTLIEIKKTINRSGAKKVIYLSCNPVSLAFDLKQLTEAYRITRIQPFDMLPQTHHLETLVLLEKI